SSILDRNAKAIPRGLHTARNVLVKLGNKHNKTTLEPACQQVIDHGPDPRKVDTSGVSYAALVSVADVSASKVSGATRLHQECRLRVL
ncbi:hypothetical protein BOR83_13520, partial [Corynebacterium striatum]|nr:hypothetical protein [Corynebacterium striatum]